VNEHADDDSTLGAGIAAPDSAPTHPPTGARRRRRRRFARDVGVPAMAIGAVIVAIVVVQWWMTKPPTVAPLGGGTGDYTPLQGAHTGASSTKLGATAPVFRLAAAAGGQLDLTTYRGRPVLVNFWATWCPPCRKEIPDLVTLQRNWGDTVQIVGVDLSEPLADVAQYASDFGMNYPIGLDYDGAVTSAYQLTGLPETFFLDEFGVIQDHRIGVITPAVALCIVDGIQRRAHNPKDCR
jgi:thiol-disulfide isomerase/thioredoxin